MRKQVNNQSQIQITVMPQIPDCGNKSGLQIQCPVFEWSNLKTRDHSKTGQKRPVFVWFEPQFFTQMPKKS